MKFVRASGKLSLAILVILAGPSVAADLGWYGGINIGKSKAKIDDERIANNLLGAGFTSVSISDDDSDTGGKLFVGYQFGKHFALEGGYFDLGKFSFVATTVPAGTFSGDIKVHGFNVDAVGILPFTEKFSGFARAGLIYAEAKDSFAGTGAVNVFTPTASKRDANYKVGLGLEYDFVPSFGMRIEAERHRIDDAVGNKGDIDLLSLGLVVRFGGKTPPAPVAPFVPEKVVVVVAEEPKVEEKIAVLAAQPPKVVVLAFEDVHFDYDTSTLKPEAQAILKRSVQLLKDNPKATIRIAGYTSASGTDEYNQKLSERRAKAVQDYLVKEGVVGPSRLSTVGYGENRPAEYEAAPRDLYSKAAKANMRVLFEVIVK